MTGKFKGRRRSGLRRVEGSQAGALAQAVYVCERCHCQQRDFRNRPLQEKPFFCVDPNCGGTVFTRFGSVVEANFYANLLLRERMGEVKDIKLQPRFPLHVTAPDGSRALLWTYVADFAATVCATGERAVIEVKGSVDTHISEIKRKHCETEYGFKIRLMTAL